MTPGQKETDSVYRSGPLKHLSFLPIQQQPLAPALSAYDGSASSLSSLEREAVRTRGRPWRSLWGRPGRSEAVLSCMGHLEADVEGEKEPHR